MKSSRGHRPIATKNNITTQKLEQTSKKSRATRAFICCACVYTVLSSACTQNPETKLHPYRDTPLPHLADTLDPQEGHQLREATTNRRETLEDTPREGSNCLPDEHFRAGQDHPSCGIVHKGASQRGRGEHPTPHYRPIVIKYNRTHEKGLSKLAGLTPPREATCEIGNNTSKDRVTTQHHIRTRHGTTTHKRRKEPRNAEETAA